MEKINRDSFIFYRSFYDAVKELESVHQAEIYNAIFEYVLNGQDIELKGISKAIWTLIKPQLDANNRRFLNGKKGSEHGKLGGRPSREETPKKPLKNPKETPRKPLENPKETPRKPLENPKETPNENENVNDNVNDNVNVNVNVNENVNASVFVNDWNSNFLNTNVKLIESLSENQTEQLKIIHKSFNHSVIQKVLKKCLESDFLMGKAQTEKPFVINPNFFLKIESFEKIKKGTYSKKTSQQNEDVRPSFNFRKKNQDEK
jgi:hypothetical protein